MIEVYCNCPYCKGSPVEAFVTNPFFWCHTCDKGFGPEHLLGAK